jgi:hypothetical protein
MDGEAEARQRALEHVEHFATRRRHARAANQFSGKLDGVDYGRH